MSGSPATMSAGNRPCSAELQPSWCGYHGRLDDCTKTGCSFCDGLLSHDPDRCSCCGRGHRPEPTTAALTAAQEEAITRIAALPPGAGRHAAFLRCVLGERSYFDIAVMSQSLRDDPPLTEAEMRYVAERWHADA